MDAQTARALCALNERFYRGQSASFSATREMPWPGWRRCLERMEQAAGEGGVDARGASALDVACGNLRFERFLCSERPHAPWRFFAVDNCDALVERGLRDFGAKFALEEGGGVSGATVAYQSMDVAGALLDEAAGGASLASRLTAPACDAVVAFGFLHHIPGEENRVRFLRALAEKTLSGGIVAVSLWRFADDARLAEKARATDAQARLELGLSTLDEGDYLLGWKDVARAWRYCHHFSEAEIERLSASVADRAALIDRFPSDGRSGRLNEYLVFRRL